MPHPSSLQRKPFWAPVGLAAVSAVAAALVMALLAWLLVTAQSTTVIVVRDAEPASESAAEAASGESAAAQAGAAAAALSAEGRARAELLARMFGAARVKDRVDAIYVLPTPAAQATALPLAHRLGIEPVVVAPQATQAPRAWARRLLREHRGGRILVVARANVARDLAAELSGDSDLPPIPPMEFGTMYIVTVPRIGRANLLSVDY
jgi:broad specificity phosphatase PhoE